MKHVFFFILFLATVFICHSQSYELSNKDILVKIDLKKQNDSILVISRTIINKVDEDFYVRPFNGNQIYEYHPIEDIFVIQLGRFAPGYYAETPSFLSLLKKKDTITSSIILYVPQYARAKKHICISIDYLYPLKHKAKKIIQKAITKDSENSIYMDFVLYRKYCDEISLIVDFNYDFIP